MAVSSDGVVTATVDTTTASILLTANFTVAGSPIVATAANVYSVTVYGATSVAALATAGADGSTAWPVRGLAVASAPGGIVSGIDHEAPFSTPLFYLAKAFNAAGVLLGTSTSAAITLTAPIGGFATWLKVLSTPSMSVSPDTSGPPEWSADVTTSAIKVIGRPDPVVLQDVRQFETSKLEVYTQTAAQQAAMQALLATPGPYLLQFPGYSEPDRYVMLGAYTRSRVAGNAVDPIRTWSFPLTQVIRPGVSGWSVAIPGHTYADSTARFPLYSNRSGTYNLRATT